APLGDADAFAEAHVAMRPSAADQIRRFFDICHRVHTQAHLLPQQAGLAELDAYAATLPLAFAHRRSTVADVLDAEVPDPVARSLCGLGSMLLGLPPSRLSLQTLAQSLYTYVVDGGFMFRGGVQSFIDALVESIERRGGEVAVGQAVTAITVEEDRASGVVLEDGRSVRARHVVSNADVGTTFGQLLNAADRPQAIQRKLRRLTVGSSSVVLHAAVALEAAADSPMVVASGTDLERSYAATAAGDPEAVVMWLPSLVDPTLAPAGEQVAAVCAFTPAVGGRPWADAAPEWEQRLLATADRLVPGIAAATTHTEVVTPEDLKALTSDDHGASFGWELTPLASGSARPAPRTPVAGLYLAGKWTQPGGCFLRSTVSGVFASQLVMADAGIDPAAGWQHASLPSLM
ncbi:MAG TPA: NAD(P)/FAD-dependent oxidoreductase, partial [Euzebya sp.]|nr:NAD(P)/FAD-dependent oxidoreductase [Euzebya sp.]